jgi:hypothetical protein
LSFSVFRSAGVLQSLSVSNLVIIEEDKEEKEKSGKVSRCSFSPQV